MNNVDQTISARASTHGDYATTAAVAQAIKELVKRRSEIERSPIMEESLDMIATKLARISSGNPYEVDHWHDIAGYAKLVEDSLNGPALATKGYDR